MGETNNAGEALSSCVLREHLLTICPPGKNGLQRERGHKTTGAETSFAGKDLARQLQFI
jgi:hypothetical protein